MTVLFLFIFIFSLLIFICVNRKMGRSVYSFFKRKLCRIKNIDNLISKINPTTVLPYNTNTIDLLLNNSVRIADIAYGAINECKNNRVATKDKWIKLYNFCYGYLVNNDFKYNVKLFRNSLRSFIKTNESLYDLYLIPLALKVATLDLLQERIYKIIKIQSEIDKFSNIYNLYSTEGIVKELCNNERLVYYLFLKSNYESDKYNDALDKASMFYGITAEKLCERYKNIDIKLEREVISLFNALLSKYPDMDKLEDISSCEHRFQDIDDCYKKSSGSTRLVYRKWLSIFALKASMSETEILNYIDKFLCNKHSNNIGFYLVGDGQNVLCRALNIKILTYKNKRITNRALYFCMLFSMVATLLCIYSSVFLIDNIPLQILLLLSGFPIIVFSSKRITDNLVLRFIEGNFVPSLNEKYTNFNTTTVVVPALLSSLESCKKLVGKLEMIKLSNPGFSYALLCDFSHKLSNESEISNIIDVASNSVKELNNRYSGGFAVFFRLNEIIDGARMPKERKRGALGALCDLILNGNDCFASKVGYEYVSKTKYILTIDEDTVIASGAVKKLVCAIEHPINVCSKGFSRMLQPMIINALPYNNNSYFAKNYLSGGYLPSYPCAFGDIFSHIFSKSAFGGKGIFEIKSYFDVYNKLPKNRILSHDQPEGDMLDCLLFEDAICAELVPNTVEQYLLRDHRWIRGDWQNFCYLFFKKDFSPFFKWCTFFNCLFSLSEIGICITIILLLFFAPDRLIIASVLFAIAGFNILINCLKALATVFDLSYGKYRLNKQIEKIIYQIKSYFYYLILLPCKAANSLDAILTVVFRVFISKKNLLQWDNSIKKHNIFAEFWAAPFLGLLFLIISIYKQENIVMSAIFLAILGLAPIIYKYSSHCFENNNFKRVNDEKNEALLALVAKTLCFYIDSMNNENNYLPPDNYQKEPYKGFCDRTSITNIGFGILSIACGYALGLLPKNYAVDLIEKSINSINKLEVHNGCHFNWYNVKSLSRLGNFISTVDCGNFCSCLLAASQILKSNKKDFDSLTAFKIRIILENCDDCDDKSYQFLNGYSIDAIKDFIYNAEPDKFDGHSKVIISQWKKSLMSENADASCIANKLECIALNEGISYLYNEDRHLFYIGYDVKTNKFTEGCYDLFASENLLCSYFAVCSGQVDASHWYSLSRKLIANKKAITLLSWSGTVFETYMPLIFLSTKSNTLLGIAADNVINTNIDAGEAAGTPFGISESCCGDINKNGDYVYQAFGMEELSLDTKRSLPIFAPYASIMTIERRPKEVLENIVHLVKLGMVDKYGFYESIDYRYDKPIIAKCFMAHHQGMIVASLTNYLTDEMVRKSFMEYPSMKAGRLLLYEDMPYNFDLRSVRNHIDVNNITLPYMKVQAARLKNGNNSFDISQAGFGIKYNDITISKLPEQICGNGGTVYLFDSERYWPVFWKSIVADFSHIECSSVVNGIIIECKIYPSDKNNGFIMCFNVSANNSSNIKIAVGCDLVLNNEYIYNAHPQYNDLFINTDINDECAIAYICKNNGAHSCAAALRCSCDEVELFTDRSSFYQHGSVYAIDPNVNYQYNSIGNKMLGAVFSCNNAQIELLMDSSVNKLNNFIDNSNIDIESSKLYADECGKLFMINNKLSMFDSELCLKIVQYLLLGTVKQYNDFVKRDDLYKYGISGDNKIISLNNADVFQAKTIMNIIAAISSEAIDVIIFIKDKTEEKEFIEQCDIYNQKAQVKAIIIFNDYNILSAAYCVIDGNGNGELKQISPLTHSFNLLNDQSYVDISEGFVDDGYNICDKTPRPWSNILSNGKIGCIICNDGAGFTFGENSAIQKYSLPQSDRIKNIPSEIVYLKNQNNDIWTVTSKPINNGVGYSVKHAFGYTVFNYTGFGLKCEQTVFIACDKNVKCYNLYMENTLGTTQEIEVSFIVDAFIGEHYSRDQKYCSYRSGNSYAVCEGEEGKLFLSGGDTFGTDRSAFLKGGYLRPEMRICNKNADCLCTKKTIMLGSGEATDVSFILSDQYVDYFDWKKELQYVINKYNNYLNSFTLVTQNNELDRFVSNWLPYQTLNSRFLARCGYYQHGGAFGFRDQLQDCLAILYIDTDIVRSHILKCAEHQFEYGDVLHWWHKDALGVRTLISDDRLWLVYVACKYAKFVNSDDIFKTKVAFLVGENKNEAPVYANFERTKYQTSLYDHCKRAIKVSMTAGQNGLPLIFEGDWNDGMNEIGIEGKGESVWLGWFILAVCDMFEPYAAAQGDHVFIQKMTDYCAALLNSLETFAWQGDRYIRAVTDKGEIIGSSTSEACKLDSIVQSWAVLSGFCDEERGRICIEEAYKRLYNEKQKIFKLFYPPFDQSGMRVGYINDYPKGVRENGGQYTHGAIWFAKALLYYGEADKAWNIIKCCIPFMRTNVDDWRFGNEPYVVTADIYLNGEGGWSWYTGSAGWLYTTIIESVFGITVRGDEIEISPCIPSEIKKATVILKLKQNNYEINYRNPFMRSGGKARIYIDGKRCEKIVLNNTETKATITVIV